MSNLFLTQKSNALKRSCELCCQEGLFVAALNVAGELLGDWRGLWSRATERHMPDYKGLESREEVVADYTAVRGACTPTLHAGPQ